MFSSSSYRCLFEYDIKHSIKPVHLLNGGFLSVCFGVLYVGGKGLVTADARSPSAGERVITKSAEIK